MAKKAPPNQLSLFAPPDPLPEPAPPEEPRRVEPVSKPRKPRAMSNPPRKSPRKGVGLSTEVVGPCRVAGCDEPATELNVCAMHNYGEIRLMRRPQAFKLPETTPTVLRPYADGRFVSGSKTQDDMAHEKWLEELASKWRSTSSRYRTPTKF